MVEIYRGSYIEVMNIKNLLENSNITFFASNEYMGSIQPWVVSAGGYAPVLLKVQEEDYNNAKKIVDNYNDGEYSLDI